MILRSIAILLLIASPATATTIVAVKSKKEIVIAADSKVTDTFGNATGRSACKIVAAGGVVFAYAGFARDPATAFSVPEIVAGSLNENRALPIVEKTEATAKLVAERLEAEFKQLKTKDFVTFREKIEGKTFLRIVIAGFEKGKPVLLVRHFRYGILADGSAGVSVSSDDCDAGCKGQNVTRFLGETDAIAGLPEETKGFWNQGLAAGAKKLVEIQIAAREEYVGPPVDLVRITSKQTKWITLKPECATSMPSK